MKLIYLLIPNGIIITFSDDKGNALEDFELLVVKIIVIHMNTRIKMAK